MLLIVVASTVIGVMFDYNVSETIAKYRTAIEDHYLIFTMCFVVLAILLSQTGVSFGLILGFYVAISNSIFSLLLAFISIIVSGVVSYIWLEKLSTSSDARLVEKWKTHKFIGSPFFAYFIRLIPGLPFMVQNVIIMEAGVGFPNYIISLVFISILYLTSIYSLLSLLL